MMVLLSLMGAGIMTAALLSHEPEDLERNWSLVLGSEARAFLARLRFEVVATDMTVRRGMELALERRSDPEAAKAVLAVVDEAVCAAEPLRVGSIGHLVRVLRRTGATLPLSTPQGFRLYELASAALLVRAVDMFVPLAARRLLRLQFLSAGFRVVAFVFGRKCVAIRTTGDGWVEAAAAAADWSRLDHQYLELIETVLADTTLELERVPAREQVRITVH